MKANRKFQQRDDEAVSPVIAVILMVAITVVLAATVYVWVSGFGASGSQAKQLTASVTSTQNGVGILSLTSVSPNFEWSKLKIVVDGAGTTYGILANGVYSRDAAWTSTSSTGAMAAGDIFKIAHRANGVTSVTVKFVDTGSNTVVSQISLPIAADETAPTITAATKADPSVATFSEAMHASVLTGNADVIFAPTGFTVSGALTWTNGFTTLSPDPNELPVAADTLDNFGGAGAIPLYDLAGNQWVAAYTYT